MKLIIGSTALALLLSGASLYAQEPDKDKPKDEPKKEEAAKPAAAKKQEPPKQEERAKPEPAKPQPKPEERNQPARQQDHPVQQPQQQQHSDSRNVQPQHAQAHRQPDEKFRAQIGREHHFRVTRSEDRRISYGGYYFTYGEAWPSGWDYNDDVYIDYIDGQYYLIDVRHPGVRLSLVVAD
jgi:hypothetical protein